MYYKLFKEVNGAIIVFLRKNHMKRHTKI